MLYQGIHEQRRKMAEWTLTKLKIAFALLLFTALPALSTAQTSEQANIQLTLVQELRDLEHRARALRARVPEESGLTWQEKVA